ncbi:MAG: hypothetical protein IJQ21_01455 [Lachnospiraceae bacterium]|nr:hypothetical protein [Lachnospiraceae bacterium]
MKLRALRKKTAGFLLFICAAALALTGYMVVNRRNPVSDMAGAYPAEEDGFEVTRKGTETGEDIRVAFPRDVHNEDITFENRYPERELHVVMRTAQTDYFRENAIFCNPDKVTQVTCSRTDDGIRLICRLNGLYESDLSLEDNSASVALTKPQERYSQVIVVDPVRSGAGSDLSLALAERMKRICEESGTGCKLYLTRTDERLPEAESVRNLAETAGASRLLRLIVPAGEGGRSAVVTYNDAFFIRTYGNDAFASDVARSMSIVEDMQVNGAMPDAADELLRTMKIPAATLRIDGVRSAAGEDEATIDEIATALWAGIHLGFTETGEQE